jgi:hypothetical protein
MMEPWNIMVPWHRGRAASCFVHDVVLLAYLLQSGEEEIGKDESRYDQEGLVPFVVDAVYAMAHALHNYQEEVCPTPYEVCKAMLPLAGPHLLHHIRNVTFIG